MTTAARMIELTTTRERVLDTMREATACRDRMTALLDALAGAKESLDHEIAAARGRPLRMEIAEA